MEDPQLSLASGAKWHESTIAEVPLGKCVDRETIFCRFWKIHHTLMIYSTLPAKCWMVNFSSALVEGMKKESCRCCCFNLSKRASSDAWGSLEKHKEKRGHVKSLMLGGKRQTSKQAARHCDATISNTLLYFNIWQRLWKEVSIINSLNWDHPVYKLVTYLLSWSSRSKNPVVSSLISWMQPVLSE